MVKLNIISITAKAENIIKLLEFNNGADKYLASSQLTRYLSNMTPKYGVLYFPLTEEVEFEKPIQIENDVFSQMCIFPNCDEIYVDGISGDVHVRQSGNENSPTVYAAIMLIDRNYCKLLSTYSTHLKVRSSIISTFHNDNWSGCIINLVLPKDDEIKTKKMKVPLILIDYAIDGKYYNVEFLYDRNSKDVISYAGRIVDSSVIKNLSGLKNPKGTFRVDLFNLLTTSILVPYDTSLDFVDKSDCMMLGNQDIKAYLINVDEYGSIIKDSDFRFVSDQIFLHNIKSIALYQCNSDDITKLGIRYLYEIRKKGNSAEYICIKCP